MSGAFSMPHALSGGAGYKVNPAYDEFLRRHSGFYRRHSAASAAQEEDRRRSVASVPGLDQHDPAAAAAQATKNVEAEAQAQAQAAADGQQGRRGSFVPADGGAASANVRKGSVVVASASGRKDSIFGLEASAGTNMDPGRRPSTSLASDLYHKFKGDRKTSQ